MKNILLVFALALLTSAGCRQAETDPAQKPAKKSVARETIEGFTGKMAVDTLKRAQPKIEAAGENELQKRQDVDELTKP